MNETLNYQSGKMIDLVEKAAKEYPERIAYEFFGKKKNYLQFMNEIEQCAKALTAIGVREDDVVCIAMPNTPQALIFLYAVNKIGAIANMIHPLSSENEMLTFLNRVHAKVLLMMDQFYGKVANIRSKTDLETVIIASVRDELPWYKKLPYDLTLGKKIEKISPKENILWWNSFIRRGNGNIPLPPVSDRTDRVALILHSGGTTGKIKGVCLSNRNINSSAIQLKAANPSFCYEDRMLTVMPIFHGNGLVIGVHVMLITGGECVLIPRFTVESYARDMLKYRCNYLSGVPTLYERLMNAKAMQKADLSFLKGIFSGADFLSAELEHRLNLFLKEHNSPVPVRQGYGMTECVVASTLNPPDFQKEGSIGRALPDVEIKIVQPGTCEELPLGETGEIVMHSVTNMLGYYLDPEETATVLKKHPDGKVWVHSGDLGQMDEDGFVFFKGRIKRMIVTSGYNVFPLELENIIEGHEMVARCCVLGIPDKERIEKVKAFIILKEGYEKSEKNKAILMRYFQSSIAKYAIPREIEFIDELPKTKVGKVDFNKLKESKQ